MVALLDLLQARYAFEKGTSMLRCLKRHRDERRHPQIDLAGIQEGGKAGNYLLLLELAHPICHCRARQTGGPGKTRPALSTISLQMIQNFYVDSVHSNLLSNPKAFNNIPAEVLAASAFRRRAQSFPRRSQPAHFK
jgi:hypothetical protein